MAQKQKYPVGMQDFARIREDGFVYVDKTERMFEMVTDRTFVFFARPRRFGKTLLVNTLEAYFSGRKELFRGLAVENLEKEWKRHPVLRFDMSVCKDCEVKDIEPTINWMLDQYENRLGVVAKGPNPGRRLQNLIENVTNKFGQKAVVIIDEYDSPVLAHLYEGQKDEVRRLLQEFYQTLKVMEQWERFVFITGITKFSHLSIFSTLNNLENLSMDDRFSDLCGITEEELKDCFQPGIEAMAEKYECTPDEMFARLKHKYDGYHFSKESKGIFNPFSVVKAMSCGELQNFWFESGTSTYIIEHMKHFDVRMQDLQGDVLLRSFDVPAEEASSSLPLLYQSGYLTIKGYDTELQLYTLKFPNEEVKVGMSESVLDSYAGLGFDVSSTAMLNFYVNLKNGEIDTAFAYLQNYFRTIPYTLNNKTEKHYQTILYVIMTWLGFYTQVEVTNAIGRLDVVLFIKDRIFVMEFKVDQSAEQALEQINKINYAAQYQNDGRQIIKIGVNIDSANRTVERWIVE